MDRDRRARQKRARRKMGQSHTTSPASALFDEDNGETFWGAILGGLIGIGLAAAGLAIGIGASGVAGQSKSFWYLSRSTGFVAYLLLWGSVVWGLLLSSKIGKGILRAPTLLEAHQFLSNLALGFALFHGLILTGDHYLNLSLRAILVPLASPYEPILMAVGQLAMWLSLLLIVSFYVRRRIGQKVWRLVHYSSFIAFWFALLHGVLLGSDSGLLWSRLLYWGTAALVLYLTIYRIVASVAKAADRRSGRPTRHSPATGD